MFIWRAWAGYITHFIHLCKRVNGGRCNGGRTNRGKAGRCVLKDTRSREEGAPPQGKTPKNWDITKQNQPPPPKKTSLFFYDILRSYGYVTQTVYISHIFLYLC